MKRKKLGGLLPKIILTVVAVYALISLLTLKGKIAQAQEQKDELAAMVETQALENAELADDISRKDDPEKKAELARENFGLVESGETVFYDIG